MICKPLKLTVNSIVLGKLLLLKNGLSSEEILHLQYGWAPYHLPKGGWPNNGVNKVENIHLMVKENLTK